MSNIEYDCRWSNEVDEKFVKDFSQVEKSVFGEYNSGNFERKYIKNIYGASVLCVVYIDGVPCAARALWRNDIQGQEAYQPVETCVLDKCRGQGVFSEMTRKTIAMLSSAALIYNFPNHNSFPGYLKLGWKELNQLHLVLFDIKGFNQEYPIDIDIAYFNWWLKGRPHLRVFKHKQQCFLVSPGPRRFCYTVIGRIPKEVAKDVPIINKLSLIFYKSTKMTFYNRKFAFGHVVARTTEEALCVPRWKIDVV